MNGMNHAEELMDKPMDFCPVCLKKLHWNLGFDMAARFQALSKICHQSKNRFLAKLGEEYNRKVKFLTDHQIIAKATVAPPTATQSGPTSQAKQKSSIGPGVSSVGKQAPGKARGASFDKPTGTALGKPAGSVPKPVRAKPVPKPSLPAPAKAQPPKPAPGHGFKSSSTGASKGLPSKADKKK